MPLHKVGVDYFSPSFIFQHFWTISSNILSFWVFFSFLPSYINKILPYSLPDGFGVWRQQKTCCPALPACAVSEKNGDGKD